MPTEARGRLLIVPHRPTVTSPWPSDIDFMALAEEGRATIDGHETSKGSEGLYASYVSVIVNPRLP